MRISSVLSAAFVACQVLSLGTSVQAQKDNLPKLHGATLLMGWPSYKLALTTEGKTVRLQDVKGDLWWTTPSISADGQIVATARRLAGYAEVAGRPILVVSTFSMRDGKWTEYKDLKTLSGPIAISPDGSKLACVTWGRDKGPGGKIEPDRLRVLDLKTGTVSAFPELSVSGNSQITWSPDSRRITFDEWEEIGASVNDLHWPSTIWILDVDTGAAKKIADGWTPSWSPSGEWIAYFDYPSKKRSRIWPMSLMTPERINIVRPNGTDSRVLRTWHSFDPDDLKLAPVWSPDAKRILINRIRDEADNVNVYMLDLATNKLTRKFKKSPPIYAWVAPR
jgi:dipeptidyl aminopeptidase/acylaminoacyl peptidase